MGPRIGVTLAWDPTMPGTVYGKSTALASWQRGGFPSFCRTYPLIRRIRCWKSWPGLVISGGETIRPSSTAGRGTSPPAAGMNWEMALLRSARDRGLPVLGVCRGCQGLNIAWGGDLLPHLAPNGPYPGHQQQLPRQRTSHWVILTPPYRSAGSMERRGFG